MRIPGAWISLATVVALAATSLAPSPANALSLRRICRRECKGAILTCATSGKSRRLCRRQLLRACRAEGLAVCLPQHPTTTSSSVTSTTIAGSTTTTTLPPELNGCTSYTARLDPLDPHTVSFMSFAYSPPCLEIRAGQNVRFTGEFTFHPLVAGAIVDGTPIRDTKSPIPTTSFGTAITVTFTKPGFYPFYCGQHGVVYAMKGVVWAIP